MKADASHRTRLYQATRMHGELYLQQQLQPCSHRLSSPMQPVQVQVQVQRAQRARRLRRARQRLATERPAAERRRVSKQIWRVEVSDEVATCLSASHHSSRPDEASTLSTLPLPRSTSTCISLEAEAGDVRAQWSACTWSTHVGGIAIFRKSFCPLKSRLQRRNVHAL